jgi:anti-sigma regulatory factor (Ser/Thr protein kinase)
MATAPTFFRFELQNSLSEISRMSDWLRGVLREIGANDDVSHAVCLSVVEAVTNVVSDAFAPGTDHRIDVAVDVAPDELVVVIADDGIAFDPLARPAAVPAADLASAEIGGLGIALMREFSSRISYVRADDRNLLEMGFPL